MCLYEAKQMACECCEWGKRKLVCCAYRQPCGRKSVAAERWHTEKRCKICQQIQNKQASIKKKETRVRQWREKELKRKTKETPRPLLEKMKLLKAKRVEREVEKSGSNEWEGETLRGEATQSEDGDSLRKEATGGPHRSKVQMMLSYLSCRNTMDEEPLEKPKHTPEPSVSRPVRHRETSIKKVEGEIFFLCRDIEQLLLARDEKRANTSISFKERYKNPNVLDPLPVKRKMEPRDETDWTGREPIGTLNLDPVIVNAYRPETLKTHDNGWLWAALEQADTETHTCYLLHGDQETSRAARLPPKVREAKREPFLRAV